MLKRALIALAVLLLLAGGAAFVAFNYLDVAVKWALEHYGPDVAGVPIKVREVQISPRNGRGAVRALEIGNPPGFGSGRAARFGEIRLQIDPSTITQPVIVVRELTVEEPSITYERAGGTTNLEAIQRNIDAYVKRSAADEGGAGGGRKPREAKRRFIVERLTLRGAKVTMTNPALKGQGIVFDLPDITLRDVGRRQGGLTASELANVVANALTQRIAQKVLTNVDLLRKGGVEGAVDALKGLFR
jgi:uncharacterized protein involved in outer membrane biogenesis